ncbi:MAG: hypothetical protein ABI665_13010 [Vicinamibacterales bacterium]
MQGERATRLDPKEFPGEWTTRQSETYIKQGTTLDRRIMHILQSMNIQQEVTTKRAPFVESKTLFLLWRKEYGDLLLSLPPRDPRVTSVATCIQAIDFGVSWRDGMAVIPPMLRDKLMNAFTPTWERGVDPWRYVAGDLKTCEQRLKELDAQYDAAQATLNDAMLDDDERAARDTTDREYQAALNTMRIKNSPLCDGTLICYDKTTGEPLTAFTDAQRKALQRLNATQPVSNMPTAANSAG